jgi:hypothetical protein
MPRNKKIKIIATVEFEINSNEVPVEYLIETKQRENLLSGKEVFFPSSDEIASMIVGEAASIKSGCFENIYGNIIEAKVAGRRERLSERELQ